MLFSSVEYFIFLPLVFVFYRISSLKLTWIVLLVSSMLFLAYSDIRSLLLVLSIILINYFAAFILDLPSFRQRKRLIFISTLVLNIGILSFFKYFNFLNDNISAVFSFVNHDNPIPSLSLILPLGISFYTFQVIGYLYEVYSGAQKAEVHLGRFAAYILFFPKLVAGPVERSYNFFPQFNRKYHADYNEIVMGIRLILWGLFKKILIADRLAIFVNYGFTNLEGKSGLTLFILIFLQAFQLYADFSGYTDVALGSARILGFNIKNNFNKPFLANSVSEYWRRWHISLASWVNDYIYKPLSLSIAINRNWGYWGIIYALTVTFVIFGLWHGAAWKFVVFGFVQSLALSYEVLTRKIRRKVSRKIPSALYQPLSIIITFLFVCYSAIFFRANSLADALQVITGSFSGIIHIVSPLKILLSLKELGMNKWDIFVSFSGILIIVVTHLSRYKDINDALENKHVLSRWVVYVSLIVAIIFLGTFKSTSFMYFQF